MQCVIRARTKRQVCNVSNKYRTDSPACLQEHPVAIDPGDLLCFMHSRLMSCRALLDETCTIAVVMSRLCTAVQA